MTTVVVCGVCKRRLKLPPHAMGRLVQCPGCQTNFTAEEPVDVALAEEEVPVLEPVESAPAPAPADAFADLPGPTRPAPAAPAGPPRAVAQPPFWFSGRVVGDSERSLRGSVRLRVTQNGLEVWQGETLDLLIPLGTPAEVDGADVRLRFDGRRIELRVARGFGMSARLAHDLAEFLGGQRRSLVPHQYQA